MTTSRYKEYEFAEGWASVSQICGLLEKPYLYQWYAKLGAEATRINTASKKIGNLIDNEICIYFGDEGVTDLDRSILEHPENKAFFNQALKNFYTVAEHLKCKSIMGQKVVYSKEHKYIGTFDRFLAIEGKLVLSDWKATNFVDYGYTMQLEAYYRALIEMIKAGTLVIPDEFKGLEWHEYPLWLIQFPKKEVVNLDKNIIRFKPKDLRYNNFLSLLSYYYGKIQDEEEDKVIKNEFKKAKTKKEK